MAPTMRMAPIPEYVAEPMGAFPFVPEWTADGGYSSVNEQMNAIAPPQWTATNTFIEPMGAIPQPAGFAPIPTFAEQNAYGGFATPV